MATPGDSHREVRIPNRREGLTTKENWGEEKVLYHDVVVVTSQYRLVEICQPVHLNTVNYNSVYYIPIQLSKTNKNKAVLKNKNHYKWYSPTSHSGKGGAQVGPEWQAE